MTRFIDFLAVLAWFVALTWFVLANDQTIFEGMVLFGLSVIMLLVQRDA